MKKSLFFLLLIAIPSYLFAGNQMVYQQDFDNVKGKLSDSKIRNTSGWAGGEVTLDLVDDSSENGKMLQAEISGYGQIELGSFKVNKGKNYLVKATVSSLGAQNVTFMLRQTEGPYHKHGILTTQVFESPRELVLLIRNAQKTNYVHVQLTINATTTLQIDDVSVEQVDNLPNLSKNPLDQLLPDPELPVGNLLANSGFELGEEGFLYRGKVQFIKSGNAFEGQSMAIIENGSLVSSFIKLPLRHETLAVARVKALHGSTTATISFGDYMTFRGSTDSGIKKFKITPEEGWKRIAFKWKPKIKEGQLLPMEPFYFQVSGEDIAVDGLEVRHLGEGQQTEDQNYLPRSPQEHRLDIDAPYHTLTVGERVPVTLSSTQESGKVKLYAFDEKGNEYRSWTLDLLDHQSQVSLDMPAGAWRFTTSATGSANHISIQPPEIIHGETMALVVPPMPELPLDRWHFGSHIGPDSDMLKAHYKLGLRWTRMHDASSYAKWPIFEKTPGQYHLNEKTEILKKSSGHHVLANIDWIPNWAPMNGKKSENSRASFSQATEKTFPLLTKATEQLAIQGKGLIDEYEITNEPNLKGVKPEMYLEVLKAAHAGLKKGNPDANIVALGGSCPAGTKWMYQCITLGAGKYAEAISFHAYGLVPNGQNKGPQRLIDLIAQIDKALEEAGTPNKKIYDTESGFIIRSNLSKNYNPTGNATPELVAKSFPKAVAGVIASGLDRWFYYSSFDQSHPGDGNAYSVSESDHSIKMSFQPMAVAISMLEGKEYDAQASVQGDLVHLVYTGLGQKVEMLWTIKGAQKIKKPNGKVFNMYGREIPLKAELDIDDEPVYVVSQLKN